MIPGVARHPIQELPIAGDAYKLQRRPRHPHVVINDSYQGLRIIDPVARQDVLRHPYPKRFLESPVASEWCLRSDGGAVLVLSAETRTACLLLLAEDRSFDLDAPELRSIHDIRYIWDERSFFVTGGKSQNFFELIWRDGAPSFVPADSLRVRTAHPLWRRAIDQLPIDGCNVLRVEPDESRVLYYKFAPEPGELGTLSWDGEPRWTSPAPREVPRLAFYSQRAYLLQEREVHELDAHGAVRAVFSAPEGTHLVDLDILPATDSRRPELMVLASAIGDQEDSRLLIYEVDK